MAITIPSGGTIRETVSWEATVPSGATFDFYIFSIYGHDIDGTLENFSQTFSGYITTGDIPGTSRMDNLDMVIPFEALLDTYDCLTIVGDFDGQVVYAFDFEIKPNVLIIESPLGAVIISTTFNAI